MSAHDMGSWIITATFVLTSAYLIYESKQYQPLQLLGCAATALVMCFCGLLFTGAISYAAAESGVALTNKVVLSLLVSVGVIVCMLIRHGWNRNRRP